MGKVSRFSCDVLIIGAGASGLRAAIEAHDNGSDVLVVGKSKHGDAHTVLATGGINAALATTDHQDNWLIHAADTLKEGQFLADYKFVETLCKNAPVAVKELLKWRARFAKDKKGKLIQRFFGAHTYRRTCFFGDQTGKEIMRVLLRQIEKRKIEVIDNIFIMHLVKDNNKINGAIGINLINKDLVIINAKAVIVATGGHSKIYLISSSRYYENLGDGISLSYELGCELMDMEMIQFHPTGMIYPRKMIGVLVTEAVRGEGGILLNRYNERFMEKYDSKRKELSARDIVARSVYNEIIHGRGTKHDGVWLDISFKPALYIKKRLPKIYKQFKSVGVDITKQKMEVAPTSHYSMGGIRTYLNGETNVKGLFAVGEVTGDVHGANRLGGNSLAETVVYGRITGKAASQFAKRIKNKEINVEHLDKLFLEFNNLINIKGKINPNKIKEEAQIIMWKYVGIIRERRTLENGLNKLQQLKKKLEKVRIKSIGDIIDFFDARNVVLVSEIVIKSALLRKESRGAHYRSDFPRQSKRWLKHVIFRNINGKMNWYFKKTPSVKGKLAKVIKQQLGAKYHLLE